MAIKVNGINVSGNPRHPERGFGISLFNEDHSVDVYAMIDEDKARQIAYDILNCLGDDCEPEYNEEVEIDEVY